MKRTKEERAKILEDLNAKIKECLQLCNAIDATMDDEQFGPAGDMLADKLQDTKKEACDLIDDLTV